jgi:hypothetical protein
MVPGTLSARSYRFAFLFSGQPQMSRDDNLRFYDNLTAQGVELPTFEQKKNEIILQNTRGDVPPYIMRVTVGHFTDKFRLFILEDFPSGSMEIFQQTADAAWKVFSDVWKGSTQGLSLAEATLRYTAVAKGGSATNFLLGSCLKIPKEALASLGRPAHGVGLRLVSPVLVAPNGKAPLSNADFNLNIETLLEDPSRLYIQVTVKWPSLPLPPARRPEAADTKGLPAFLNPECREPSWYLKEVEGFVKKQIEDFLCNAGK